MTVMPYKSKKDHAAQKRRYRQRKKLELEALKLEVKKLREIVYGSS